MSGNDLARKVLIAIIEDDLGLEPPPGAPEVNVARDALLTARRGVVQAGAKRFNEIKRLRAQKGL